MKIKKKWNKARIADKINKKNNRIIRITSKKNKDLVKIS